MDVWTDIEFLLKNRKIGFAATCVFAAVWKMAGCQPREKFTVTTNEIKAKLGRDRSSILAQIKILHSIHDLFHVRERDRWGRYQIDIYRPAAGHVDAQRDRQKVLPGFTEFAIIGLEASCVEPGVAVQGGGLKSQESQRSGLTGEPQRLAAVTALEEGRGANPTETADPWGIPHAPDLEGVGEVPTIKALQARGEFPTPQNPAFSAEKTTVGISPRRGDFPTTGTVGNSPRAVSGPVRAIYPAPAPASFVPMKEDIISSNGSNDPKEPNDRTNDARGPAAQRQTVGNSPRPIDPDEAAIAALGRQLEQRRQQAARREPEPLAASQTIVEAINSRFSPTAQKVRLVAEIRNLANDPETDEWLYGYAADLMLVHGQSSRPDASEIYTRMERLLAELREFHDLRQRMGQSPKPRGRVLCCRVMQIASAYGIPTPKQLKQQREAERRRQRAR